MDGTYITKAQAKNKRNGVKKGFVGRWKLWPGTVSALRYGLKTKDCEREYMKLREKYDLPEAMALKKTVAQWVQELAGEEESKVPYCGTIISTRPNCSRSMSHLTLDARL